MIRQNIFACPFHDFRSRVAAKRGFTLIELLTVIAIIGILAAIIIPTVSKVRSSARAATCRSNLRQLGVAGLLYAEDNRGKLFPYRDSSNQDKGWNWLLMPYSGATSSHGTTAPIPVFLCPVQPIPVVAPVFYPRFTYAINNTLVALDAGAPEPRLDAITDRQQVIFFGDSSQVPQWSGASTYAFRWNRRPIPGPEGILSPASDPDVDDNSNHGYFRYRHNGLSHAVFLDGSVRAFKPGEMRNRNYYWPY
ncbi:prepilin-type N-terminal cleavage/methylation domain-containing protein [Geminisphaera colitermitum]|uniref:prepilin-type N-terminal cleavage/methylation domain-containing protein n=1 Tax=Geminisphaera colitermitum TaxID=1148786 RepID=UPI000158CF36|nr:prepilin-type N-terminal cleavage/methylation domain-containing protein [Geminisphaera colitermitum]